MKPYPKYINSAVDWIGAIPKQWNIRKIRHTTYVKGRIGWKGLKSDEFQDVSDAYLVTGTDFEEGKVRWESCYQIDKMRYEEDPYIQLKENDLLITKDGSIGKIALVKGLDGLATLNSGIFLTRPLSYYIADFLYWILCSDIFYSFISYNSMGSTIQHLYQNVFHEFQFPTPPIFEQKQIAKYLDQKTAKIDSLIEKKKRLIELLKEERTAVINEAVTKGLDPNIPMKDSGIEWLGEIPEHWGVKRLKNVGKVRQGLQIPISKRYYDKIPNSYEYITVQSIHNPNNSKEYILNPSPNVICNEEDILVARTGATGEIFTGLHGVFHNNFFLFDYDRESYDRMFLVYYLENKPINDYLLLVAGVTTIPDLNHGDFYETPFLEPPFDEQNQIVKHIRNKTTRIDTIISKSEKEIEFLQEYRTALISEVVTGKIDVREETI